MKIIESLLKKLKVLFKNTTKITGNDLSEQPFGVVSFILNDDLNIDIKVSLPNIKNKNVDELTALSEKYGIFLSNISDGSLSDIILEIINKSKEKCHDPVQQLFIENIIFFWSIFYAEKRNQNKKKQKKNSPIIRPLAVFSHNQLN